MNHEIFISYSSKDATAAQAVCHVLEENGIRCWMAPRDIPAGTEYGDLIDMAIKKAAIVIVVFSQTAAESQWVKGELNIAFVEQKVIIPYRIDSTPFEGQNRVILNHKHWIDAYPDYKTKFDDLVIAVQVALGRNINTAEQSHHTKSHIRKGLHLSTKAIASIVIAILIAVGAIAYFNLNKTGFSYNRNGITVAQTRNFNDSQKQAVTEILDNMVFVEGGTFEMGNNPEFNDYLTLLDSLSTNQHQVKLDSYYISKYEVTQKQWKNFANAAGCYIECGDNKAIDKISWEEAKQFADSLAHITGLKISLPTEAQWEYAAGSGMWRNPYPFSGFEDGIHHYAWIKTDNLTSAADVGKKLPNALGLYDMTGNVGEWCLDDYTPYTTETQTNPIKEVGNQKKIYRGGDYLTSNIMDMKTTTRYYAPSFAKREGVGLRLVINIR